MKLLLHVCCAPCSIMCVETLRAEGLEPVGFWDNPNIHPYTEYRSRKNTLVDYAKSIGLELVLHAEYGLRPFVREVADDIDGRCAKCYDLRMDAAARYAVQNGYTHFSSTLFVSPYQNHELLKAVAEAAAARHQVEFLYRDFRPYFREGQDRARALGLYMQKYCGCIFSEEERYQKRKRAPSGSQPPKEN